MLHSTGMWNSRAISRISPITSREILGSRLEVGSSTSSSFGFWISARAMPTRWRWPPESRSARLSMWSARPTRSSSTSACSMSSLVNMRSTLRSVPV